MNTASIFIKTDPQVKEDAQKTAEELGLSLSSIINAYLRELIRTKRVTFNARPEIPNAYFKQAIEDAREARKQGKASPIFETAEEMKAWLKKQGV